MNKIVREHYPVANLPDDLKAGMPPDATVTVTVEQERKAPSKEELLEQLYRFRQQNPHRVTIEEAVDRIRQLRDEWED